jgi:tetratricopeptide (TPR) repeat protein
VFTFGVAVIGVATGARSRKHGSKAASASASASAHPLYGSNGVNSGSSGSSELYSRKEEEHEEDNPLLKGGVWFGLVALVVLGVLYFTHLHKLTGNEEIITPARGRAHESTITSTPASSTASDSSAQSGGPETLKAGACPTWSSANLVGAYGNMQGQWASRFECHDGKACDLWYQGMIHYFGYNKVESIRNFRACLNVDASKLECLMGVALAAAPNINEGMSDMELIEGREALDKAMKILQPMRVTNRSPYGLRLINDLILASNVLFPHSVDERNKLGQTHFDQLYADAMLGVYNTFPENDDVIAIYAESVFNLSPWNYWVYPPREPMPDFHDEAYVPHKRIPVEMKPTIVPAYNALKSMFARNHRQPLGLHLLVHLLEAGPNPADGNPAANALYDLARDEGAGHLAHMPAHVFARTGRYEDCIVASQRSIELDEKYTQKCLTPYFPEHNKALLVEAALMSGRGMLAEEYATLRATEMSSDLVMYPAGVLETLPKETEWIRMGKWTKILKRNGLGDNLRRRMQVADSSAIPAYYRALDSYAKTLALLHSGMRSKATYEFGHLKEHVANIPPDMLAEPSFMASYRQKQGALMRDMAKAAFFVLSQNYGEAKAMLKSMVYTRDNFNYLEPEHFYMPPRQCLGAVLIAEADTLQRIDPERAHFLLEQAVEVYTEDLLLRPSNGWSLKGMANAQTRLAGTDRHRHNQALVDAARWNEAEYEKAFMYGDRRLEGSCCELGLC